ncbi:unnamed protein product [Moneuplotes crassus]|uniref:Uncharacterized protein n=1 Tax=Euplotes crassus TaxID=5936 RepID=A0AAD1U235_EUPCR|nr:unnamed protein product [Moneuplotes crassus]
MQKEIRKTEFWKPIQVEIDQQAAPGRYDINVNSKHESHNHGKIPFGSGSTRFGEDFPMLNCLPGPGSYNYKSNLIQTNQSKAPKFSPLTDNKGSTRFDSPRTSLASHSGTDINIQRKPQITQKVKKTPMKSSLSSGVKPELKADRSKETIDLSPGKYDPNYKVIKKNVPTISMGSNTSKNIGSMKNYMESFIRTILPAAEENDPYSLLEPDEVKPSIAGRISKDKTESSIFSSKTIRGLKISQTPGPGSYIHENTGLHRIMKNIPESFGTTSVKNTRFLNSSIEAPYSDPSYLDNPGAGTYSNIKPNRNKVIRKIRLPGMLRTKLKKKSPFLSTDIRKCLTNSQDSENLPGPGAYDLSFRDQLKTLDQKYSQRYKKNPFGSHGSRFGRRKIKNKRVSQALSIEEEQAPQDKHLARVYIDETIEKIKKDEQRKTTFQFKSATRRFKEDTVAHKKEVFNGIQPARYWNQDKMMSESHHKSSKRHLTKDLENQIFLRNISPRFNYTKESLKAMEVPGPGTYSVNQKSITKHLEASPSFRAASRDQDSIFGKIVRKAGFGPGPGSYNSNVSTVVKKTFNANLV